MECVVYLYDFSLSRCELLLFCRILLRASSANCHQPCRVWQHSAQNLAMRKKAQLQQGFLKSHDRAKLYKNTELASDSHQPFLSILIINYKHKETIYSVISSLFFFLWLIIIVISMTLFLCNTVVFFNFDHGFGGEWGVWISHHICLMNYESQTVTDLQITQTHYYSHYDIQAMRIVELNHNRKPNIFTLR